jgi:AcrR family transcriptional regulator
MLPESDSPHDVNTYSQCIRAPGSCQLTRLRLDSGEGSDYNVTTSSRTLTPMTRKVETVVRQDQIANAALALIAQQGLRRTSVASVARRVGLVPSAIYRHYRGKDEMLNAVLELVRDRLHDNVRAVTTETPDALERLRRLLGLHASLLAKQPGILRVVFSEEVYAGSAARRTKVFRTVKAYLKGIEDIIRQGQAANTVKRDLDPATTALMFLGLIQPAAILSHMSGGEVDVARHVEQAWPVFAGAIRA